MKLAYLIKELPFSFKLELTKTLPLISGISLCHWCFILAIAFLWTLKLNFDNALGRDNFSKWRKLDSRSLGITRSMISLSSWIVLKILRSAGDA